MNNVFLSKMSYGVYIVTSNLDGKDSGCMMNGVGQITIDPVQISLCLNKYSMTRDFISKSKKVSLSVLDISMPFSTVKHFGFSTGKTKDKFADFKDVQRLNNGCLGITKGINCWISCEVVKEIDFETHTMFIAKVTEEKIISHLPSATYEYYQRKIKTEKNCCSKSLCGKVPALSNTLTERNLMKAFTAESRARNKYTYFASVAKKNGFEQIGAFFQKTADNEKEHAELWFKALGLLGDTKMNLEDAADGEHYEWNEMYSEYAIIADEEGFHDIAEQFRGAAEIERHHEERFRKLLENVNKDEVFEKCKIVIWECRNCGHIFAGTTAPEECPVCKHAKSYFELHCENY